MKKSVRRKLGFSLVAFVALVGFWSLTQDLPYVIAEPGKTFNVLGEYEGQDIVQVSGVPKTDNPGRLDMLTISVWGSPGNSPKFIDLIEPYFSNAKSILPIEEFFPIDQTEAEANALATKDFLDSQKSAILAAKKYLPESVANSLEAKLWLGGVGGPSGGLMFTLGIIDKALPDSLTGGKNIAGTGTIDASGAVGPIGGIAFKMIAASRAGDRFFLAPEENCDEVIGHIPAGLQVIPVSNVDDALAALTVIANDGNVAKLPVCSAH